ncbi:hypothetical protein BD324DRAFT_678759 [Kockovaella imperatae]|uniref:Uncharacterized protein n=1 Tax=Kockovaella imperatae TaxID=4999 RepID=A0A1Y1UR74_9TREE|nr:hypothetical protein BD324DRAFT_678759 [Kockovaella imperatae]ORX39645.1 hypothetical protein BD324DRAFT_678759 [Kockovaella imperatae]
MPRRDSEPSIPLNDLFYSHDEDGTTRKLDTDDLKELSAQFENTVAAKKWLINQATAAEVQPYLDKYTKALTSKPQTLDHDVDPDELAIRTYKDRSLWLDEAERVMEDDPGYVIFDSVLAFHDMLHRLDDQVDEASQRYEAMSNTSSETVQLNDKTAQPLSNEREVETGKTNETVTTIQGGDEMGDSEQNQISVVADGGLRQKLKHYHAEIEAAHERYEEIVLEVSEGSGIDQVMANAYLEEVKRMTVELESISDIISPAVSSGQANAAETNV